MNTDEYWMQKALGAAEMGRGQTDPNPLVGAVLVHDGEIVGQGAHLRAGSPHAEVHALRMAGNLAKGATAYVTLEPCSHFGRTPPCADALIEAGVGRVVVATEDPNPAVAGQGIERLRSAGISVTVGVCKEEALRQNEAYFWWRKTGRPLVTWKTATTLDGRIATSTGHSQYVTSSQARQDVQGLRRMHRAVGVGVGTVLADNPQLTVRDAGGTVGSRQPIRVIWDSRLRTPLEAKVFSEPGETYVYCTEQAYSGKVDYVAALEAKGHKVVIVSQSEDGRVLISESLAHLGQNGIHSLFLESGGTLVAAFLKHQCVDFVVYYIAPKLLLGGKLSVDGEGPLDMAGALALQDWIWTPVGPDMRVHARIVYPEARG